MNNDPAEGYEHEHQDHRTIAEVVVIEEIVSADKIEIVEEIIDIELYAKQKKKKPHARGYRIRIDKDYKEVHVPEMTGRQILALVGKTPEAYQLSQKFHGGQVVPVGADEIVDFRHPGVERFHTIALDPTEGGSHAA